MRSSIILLFSLGVAHSQILETRKGPVEIIGLEDSTLQRVQEKLERLPDGELHYCAADIKGGFPEAKPAGEIPLGDRAEAWEAWLATL